MSNSGVVHMQEIDEPQSWDFVFVGADTFTSRDLLSMERMVLRTLDFNLSIPVSYNFLCQYSAVSVHSRFLSIVCVLFSVICFGNQRLKLSGGSMQEKTDYGEIHSGDVADGHQVFLRPRIFARSGLFLCRSTIERH